MFTTKKDLLKLQKDYPPFGLTKELGIRRIHRTSGTTDKPLLIALNDIDIANAVEVGANCFRNAGVTDGLKIVHCLSFQGWSGGLTDYLSLEAAGGTVLSWGVGGTSLLIKMILDLGIEAISCTPSYMGIIKKVLEEEYGMKPEQLGLKLGLFGGEGGLQYPSFREKLESDWKMNAVNANYGLSEVMSIIASENYIRKNGLRFLAGDYIKANVLSNGELREIEEGLEGELVLTTKYSGGINSKFNYRTGDIISIRSVLGNEFDFEVKGRSDEMIVVKGVNLYPSTISDLVSEFNLAEGSSYQFQLEVSQKDPIDKVNLKLGASTEKDLRKNNTVEALQWNIKTKLGLNINVEVVPIEGLLNSNSKLKHIIRSL